MTADSLSPPAGWVESAAAARLVESGRPGPVSGQQPAAVGHRRPSAGSCRLRCLRHRLLDVRAGARGGPRDHRRPVGHQLQRGTGRPVAGCGQVGSGRRCAAGRGRGRCPGHHRAGTGRCHRACPARCGRQHAGTARAGHLPDGLLQLCPSQARSSQRRPVDRARVRSARRHGRFRCPRRRPVHPRLGWFGHSGRSGRLPHAGHHSALSRLSALAVRSAGPDRVPAG